MKLELGIGQRTQSVEIPDQNLTDVLTPNPMKYERMGEEEVRYALEHPIGSKKLREIVKPDEKIVLVTSDVSRPMPTYTVMPALLDEL